MKETLMKTRKGIPAALTIAIVIALLSGGVAFAYFVDFETSTNNKLGLSDEPRVDIKLSNSPNSGWSDDTSETWHINDLHPGETYTDIIYVKNAGSDSVDNLRPVWVKNSRTVVNGEEFSDYIYIVNLQDTSEVTENDVTEVEQYTDYLSNWENQTDTLTTLSEWFDVTPKIVPWSEAQGGDFVDMPMLQPGQKYALLMTYGVDPSLGNEWMGASVTFTVNFTANPVPPE